MTKRNLLLTATALTLLAGTASAEMSAQVWADLNLRAGPGPHYEILDVIPQDEAVNLNGCLATRDWCSVSYNGTDGWAYGEYLVQADAGQMPIIAAESGITVETVVYENPDQDKTTVAGGVTGAVAGAIVGGPPGAIIGAVIGSTAGAVATEVDKTVVTYVSTNQVEPIYLSGEVVTGARLPDSVVLTEIPDSDLRYAYVNGVPVIVDPADRSIVQVVR